jgi:hypothetical protein
VADHSGTMSNVVPSARSSNEPAPLPPKPLQYLQTSKLNLLPVPNSSEEQKINEAIALFMYASGRPFSLADDVFFKNMIQTLRPGFHLRGDDYFSSTADGSLMQKLYKQVNDKVSFGTTQHVIHRLANFSMCNSHAFLIGFADKTAHRSHACVCCRWRSSSTRLSTLCAPLMTPRMLGVVE